MVLPVFPVVSETFIFHKLQGLADAGAFDPFVICGRAGEKTGEFFKKRPDLKKRVRVCWPVRPRFLAALLWLPQFLRCVLPAPRRTLSYLRRGWGIFGWSILKKFYTDAEFILLNPDILHFEFGSLAVGREYLAGLLECRMIVSFRGYDLNFSGVENPSYYAQVWKRADGIHCLGKNLLERAWQRGCPPEKKTALIPPAVDKVLFRPDPGFLTEKAGASKRPLRILSIGRLEWKKGYEFALQAAALLKKAGIEFEYRVVGSGSYLEAIAFCRHSLGLDKQVHFTGALPQKEVLGHLNWADIFIHAAVSEGFCNAVMEAQAMKIPVVCTDADGLSENVENGTTGFVVPRRHPEAMAEKIKALAANEELRRRMGEAGRERVERKFGTGDQIRAFENFYREVLSIQRSVKN